MKDKGTFDPTSTNIAKCEACSSRIIRVCSFRTPYWRKDLLIPGLLGCQMHWIVPSLGEVRCGQGQRQSVYRPSPVKPLTLPKMVRKGLTNRVLHIDSLWPISMATWMAPVKACCLMAPSHYLNQSWFFYSLSWFNTILVRYQHCARYHLCQWKWLFWKIGQWISKLQSKCHLISHVLFILSAIDSLGISDADQTPCESVVSAVSSDDESGFEDTFTETIDEGTLYPCVGVFHHINKTIFKYEYRVNINIYLHFVSFLHIDKTQVVEILSQVRQEPTYFT